MDGQIAEEEHIAGARRAGPGRFNWILLERQVPAAIGDMGQRPKLVAAGHHPHAAFLDRRIVEVNNRRDHAVANMWEERLILVHWEGRPALGWLDEHF